MTTPNPTEPTTNALSPNFQVFSAGTLWAAKNKKTFRKWTRWLLQNELKFFGLERWQQNERNDGEKLEALTEKHQTNPSPRLQKA